MTLKDPMPADVVLVAIDISKNRNDVLIKVPADVAGDGWWFSTHELNMIALSLCSVQLAIAAAFGPSAGG